MTNPPTTVAPLVVVGSANVDLMLRVPRLPRPGETLEGSGFATAIGGKGANQAVAAARLGARVKFVGCVGDDANGALAAAALAAQGVDIAHLRRVNGVPTGIAIVLTDAHGENCIALDAGANQRLDASDLAALAAGTDFAQAGLLICQLESPLDSVAAALDMARARGVATLLNPAPARALPDALLDGLSFLVPNATEASLLTGIEVVDLPSAIRAAEALLAKGVATVVLTLGELGVVHAQRGRTVHRPAEAVTVADTTGAGDTFIGAFAAEWLRSGSTEQAIDYGQRAARYSVQRRGAQSAMPDVAAMLDPGASATPG